MRRRMLITLTFVMIGVGLIAYPQISKRIYDSKMTSQTVDYTRKISQTEKDKLKKEWQKAVEYNQNLVGKPTRDPFIPNSGMTYPDTYLQVLNYPDETMAIIEIPKIAVHLPVYHGTNESVLQKGVGHMEGTSLPIGGKGTHSVLTGHTGLAHSKIFTDLSELAIDDLFYIHVLDKVLAYRIDQIKVVKPDKLDDLNLDAKKDYTTLITCTPYGVNSHRLLVRGVRTEYIPAEKEKIQPVTKKTEADRILEKAVIITSGIMLFLILLTYVLKKYSTKRNAEINKS
ncbi:class C sortase [Vagococcus acidifermentans]|uniref:Class C sortase n=1 Tax=Vagococcus acidifermentans TaxID=564710 RepID=A0A430ATX8_9ENTE|nr:class C sortase [Vagococcus acidifermentans]RSU11513.1 hypothetical protein CBF27_08455 [Vagococcus acidifermentans]